MHFSLSVVAILIVALAFTIAQDFDGVLPPCGVNCSQPAAEAAGCLTLIACFCNNAQFQQIAGPCFLANCSASDQQSVTNAQEVTCATLPGIAVPGGSNPTNSTGSVIGGASGTAVSSTGGSPTLPGNTNSAQSTSTSNGTVIGGTSGTSVPVLPENTGAANSTSTSNGGVIGGAVGGAVGGVVLVGILLSCFSRVCRGFWQRFFGLGRSNYSWRVDRTPARPISETKVPLEAPSQGLSISEQKPTTAAADDGEPTLPEYVPNL